MKRFIALLLSIVLCVQPVLAQKTTQVEGEIPGSPYVELVATHLVPMDKIEASIDGTKMPVYEIANGSYQVVPNKNGQLDVTITLINDQHTTKSIEITDVDTTSPILISSEQEDGFLTIYFEENSGMLDYENIFAQTADGTISKPISYDEKALSVTFRYPEEALNIFVSDRSENTLQIAVSLK